MKTKKIHLVIDSNHLRRDVGFSKSDMLFLKALSKHNLIKLHFPWMIYRECTSANIDTIKTQLHGAVNALENLTRKGLHVEEASDLNRIAGNIKKVVLEVRNSVETVWKDFISETGSELHPFEMADSKIVFDNYFAGKAPFKRLKSREDIPDAFIFEALKKIASKQNVFFITEDKNLAEKCALENDIIVFSDFDLFFKSTEFSFVKSEYDRLEEYSKLKKDLFNRKDEIILAIEDHLSGLLPFKPSSSYDEFDESDTTINGMENIDVEILEEETRFIDNEFHLSVFIKANADIEYFIAKSEYMSSDVNRRITVTDWNNHVFFAEEYVKITLQQVVVISAESITADSDLEIQYGDFEEADIEFNES